MSKLPGLCGLFVLATLAAVPRVLGQGAVSGQVRIQERPGKTTPDLGNVVVYLQPAPGTALRLGEMKTRIAMHTRRFLPRVRVVTVGSTVEFPNEDPFRHNVFSNASPGAFDLGLYGRGSAKGAKFAHAGVFPIFCNIHSKMTAFVIAVPTPYFTQAGADGRFTIPGVRAGRYTLHVWHERGGAHAREIEVPEGGLTGVDAQLDARGYKFVQHKNKFGQEYTTAGRDRY